MLKKKAGNELDMGERIPVISDFLERLTRAMVAFKSFDKIDSQPPSHEN